jgi:hypothetical protein
MRALASWRFRLLLSSLAEWCTFFPFFVRPCAPFRRERSERAEPPTCKNATYVVFCAKNNQLIAKKATFKKILIVQRTVLKKIYFCGRK